MRALPSRAQASTATVPAMPLPGTVVITGANGFIARHLHHRLVGEGVTVRGVDLQADPARGVRAGSTTAPEAWAGLLAGADAVVHTAALVSNVAPLDRIWEVNVLGTSRVLEAAARAGVPHVVHLSSIAAFGPDFPDGVTEDHPPRVTGASYGDTKVAGEAVALAAHAAGRIDVTVLRPGDVYGPGSRPWVLIPLDLVRRRQALLPDRGRGIFSPVYVDNLVDATLLALSEPAARGQVFTITDGVGVTCADYFGRLAALVDGRVTLLPTAVARPIALAVGTLTRAVGRESELSGPSVAMLLRRGTYSIEKARRSLGFEPVVDLDEGMRRVGAWLDEEGLR
jgi:2-alkyl-3-oxoalkanoate reductase